MQARALNPLTIMALGLMIAACGPIVQVGGNSPAPDALLTLRADAANNGNAAARTANAPPMLVTLPAVPGALRTLRIPVTTRSTELAYLAKANWVEQPNVLFQRLLVDVISARSGRAVLDERSASLGPALRLGGRLSEFGLDVRGGGADAHIRFDAVLSDTNNRLIATRSFEARVAAGAETGDAVARALNSGANRMAGEIADWIARSR